MCLLRCSMWTLIFAFAETLIASAGTVKDPVAIVEVKPGYSDEARRARYEGDTFLSVDVDARGRPKNVRPVRPLGLGLDEEAIKALRQWRFRPATKDGEPVEKTIFIEIDFRLSKKTKARIVSRAASPPLYGDH